MENKELVADIKAWLRDFRKTTPSNVQEDGDTFEGSAYLLLERALRIIEEN